MLIPGKLYKLKNFRPGTMFLLVKELNGTYHVVMTAITPKTNPVLMFASLKKLNGSTVDQDTLIFLLEDNLVVIPGLFDERALELV